MSEYRDWSTIPVSEPMTSGEWEDLLIDLESGANNYDQHEKVRTALAERLARMEKLCAERTDK